MNKPKISIIIPVYNNEKYIFQCLESVVNQTFGDIEIIVVNDGSEDGSQEIIDSFVTSFPGKIVKINQENSGINQARTTGLDAAHGEYIMFMDADDWLEHNTCETVYYHAIETGSDLVEFSVKIIYEDDYNKNKICTKLVRNLKNINDPFSSDTIVAELDVFWNKMYKYTLIKDNDIKFYKGKYFEDSGTIPVILALAKNYSYLDFDGYNYRKHALGHSIKSFDKNIYFHNIFSVNNLLDEFVERDLMNKHTMYLFRYSFSIIFIKDNWYKRRTRREKKEYLMEAERFFKKFFSKCRKFHIFQVPIQFIFIIILRNHLYFLLLIVRRIYDKISASRFKLFLDRNKIHNKEDLI